MNFFSLYHKLLLLMKKMTTDYEERVVFNLYMSVIEH